MTDAREVARRTLDIIPFVMRVMAAQMRQSNGNATDSHIPLLATLKLHPHTLSELAEAMMVSAPTMSSTINTLEARGWVARERSQSDRRVVWVRITEAGLNILAEMDQDVEAQLAALLGDLPPNDRELLAKGLAILRDAFATAMDREPTQQA